MAKGIYKRGNIYWIRYAGIDGKTVFESSGSTRFKDAQTFLLKRKQAVAEGKQPVVKRISKHTFKELAVKYSEWMQGRHRSADSKAYRIKGMIAKFGNLPLKQFNTLLVEQYQTALMNQGLKPASVNKNISMIKAMFKKAVHWELVDEDVHKRVSMVKLLPESNKRLRFLTQEECCELITACDPHLKPIVITALN